MLTVKRWSWTSGTLQVSYDDTVKRERESVRGGGGGGGG